MLQGKKIFILGASSAIAKEITKVLITNGATVYGSYNSNLPENIVEAQMFKADLNDNSEVVKLCNELEEITFDGFINCAGVNLAGPLIGLEESEIDSQIDINLRAPIKVTKSILKNMIRKKSGSVIHLGSVSAHRFFRGHSIYSATKAGLEGFTKAMASEVAKRKVRVNSILPGPVMSPMLQKSIDETGMNPKDNVPMNKLIDSTEIANMCLFLLSDQAPSLTGTTIPIDGGYTLW